MSAQILKYELTDAWEQQVELYEGAQILDLEYKQDKVYLWAAVEANKPKCSFTIRTVETGGSIDLIKHIHIKTLHLISPWGQPLVLHYFRAI
ncbi:DUF7352 domain-containing protein [Acinetobacter entericus]|uniref:DUF7352 domain-containing protein n=1 Tax=Acinetobacter entericus TaxID=2989714 RepID=A0ABT3NEE3_9GAMM|nr:hypothetical protein [Acinetobacter entericus]MCW8037932.1 hypothetical protein [Acinetobacter entericus]